MIVFLPYDAERQVLCLLGDYQWTVDESGIFCRESVLDAVAHDVVKLMRKWKNQSGEKADQVLSEMRALSLIGSDTLEVDPMQIAVGRVIYRSVRVGRRGAFHTTVPCCGRAVLLGCETEYAVCCSCLRAYVVSIHDEGDDGWGNQSYVAIFTVDRDVVTTHHQRRTRQ